MSIFKDHAPAYWAKNLPVIPLFQNDKMPAIKAWSQFCKRMPSEMEQEMWVRAFSNGNIGLPGGPQSGLVFLDIDTDDPKANSIIEKCIPQSPWHRIGRKGSVRAFRYNGHKTFQIKLAKEPDGTGGGVICELLSDGRQVVLPPSIHPDTKQAYHANCNLLDVLPMIPALTSEIEAILRAALEEAGYRLSHQGYTKVLEYVSVGARDNTITGMAGLYASAVTRGERTLKQAVEEFRAWHMTQVATVAGDDVPVEKGLERLVHFINRDLTGPKKRQLPKGWDEGLTDEERQSLGLTLDEEAEQWDFLAYQAYLKTEFDLCANDDAKRMKAIDYVLDRMARANDVNSLQEDMIFKWISEASRLPITKMVLRKRLKELREGDGISGENQTEIAEAVITDFEDIRWHESRFWSYAGSHWEAIDDDEVQRHIAREYGHLPSARKSSDIKGIMTLMAKLCKKQLQDTAITGVNFANGVLTEDLQIVSHSKAYGMTYTLPFRYIGEDHPDYKEPIRFLAFLEEVWGHCPDYHDRVQALQEAIAATIFGAGTTYARVILLYGLAQTGKTQLLNIVSSLVPEDKISTVPPNVWGDKFEPVTMANSLLNIGGELSENKLIDGMTFKQIVEGSPVPAQYKNGQVFTMRCKATHWFASNYLPKTRDNSEGFNRRWLIFTFDKIVQQSKKKVNLSTQIIAEEREAIIAWAVKAFPRLKLKNDYTLFDSHFRRINEMAGENDSVRFFTQASGRVIIPGVNAPEAPDGSKPSTPISARMIYGEYSTWCITVEGAKAVGFRKFLQRMRELSAVMGFSQIASTGENDTEGSCFAGIMLRDAQGRVIQSGSTKMSILNS